MALCSRQDVGGEEPSGICPIEDGFSVMNAAAAVLRPAGERPIRAGLGILFIPLLSLVSIKTRFSELGPPE